MIHTNIYIYINIIHFIGSVDGFIQSINIFACKHSPNAYEYATNSNYILDSDWYLKPCGINLSPILNNLPISKFDEICGFSLIIIYCTFLHLLSDFLKFSSLLYFQLRRHRAVHLYPINGIYAVVQF